MRDRVARQGSMVQRAYDQAITAGAPPSSRQMDGLAMV